MKSKQLIYVYLSILIISCNKIKTKVDVSYNQETQSGILLIDGKNKINLPKDSISISITIEEGNHTFKINKEKEFTCNIDKEGGILNLNNERFVIISNFYGEYSENSISNEFQKQLTKEPNYLLVDSLVYIYKKDSMQKISDFEIKNNLDNNRNKIKLYEAESFIKKEWDFGLNEDFPKQIKTEISENSIINIDYKTKIIPLYLFKINAVINPQYFEIRKLKDVISGKVDKREDYRKINKQMDME